MNSFCWSWLMCSVVLFMTEATTVWQVNTSIYVCNGNTIRLFENVTMTSLDMDVSLYRNGESAQIIGTWNSTHVIVADEYSRKLFIDKYGDIWIHNVYPSDEAQYTLVYMSGSNTFQSMVYLNVLVAPTLDCKPKITRVGNILSASVEANSCGKPAATVYWLDYPGILYEGKDLARLPSDQKASTYYACIEGPAIQCARTSTFSAFCSAITIEDNIGEQVTINSLLRSSFTLMVSISVLLVVIFMLLCFNTCCNLKRSISWKRNMVKKFGYRDSTDIEF